MSVTAVTFDLFGTLVAADRPADPAAAVARELRDRGVAVPADWADAYREPHVDAPPGAAVSLPRHVERALADRGVDAPEETVDRAVLAAFEPSARVRPGAREALAAARGRSTAVGVLSNCSVPGLVGRTLDCAGLADAVDAVATSVGCGWRKPDERAFRAAACALDADPSALLHVGDDRATDGGVADAGGRFCYLDDVPLDEFPAWLSARA